MIPFVSICCITYNQEKYIEDTIKGFLAQKTSFPIEIIIHDDASTDNTAVIVKEYADKYPEKIHPIYQVENQFSKGIKVSATYVWPQAKGKYIALCEGDDYWTDPFKLQKQVDFLESNPDCGLVHTGAQISRNGILESLPIDKSKLKSGKIYDQMLCENTICTATVLFRAEYLTELLNDKNIIRFKSTDKFLWLYIAQQAKIGYIEDITTVYRVVDNSMSRQNNLKKRAEFIKSSIELSWYYIDKYGCSINMLKKILKKHVRDGLGLRSAPIIKEAYSRLTQIEQLTGKDKFIILIASNRKLLYLYARFNAFLRKLKLTAGESNQ